MIRPLWVEVDLEALSRNLEILEKRIEGKARIVATIKQFAYGHGLLPVSKQLALNGIDWFGVGSVEEAIALREDDYKGSILVLSSVLKKFVSYFIHYNIIPTVVDAEFARALDREAAKSKRVAPVHVKVDTGMGRLGAYYKDAESFIGELSGLKNISLEGIYTHFPVADTDSDFTNHQIEAFNGLLKSLSARQIGFKYRHCANSIGILNYPDSHFNMVRPGLILYGVYPTPLEEIGVEPVLSLKSRVIFVKKIEKGMSVGYGRTFIAEKDRFVATVAVGYADGYPWSLSNKAKVIIRDKIYRVIGRVCMDHIMVDLGDDGNISQGEEVVLIGKSERNSITAEQLADWAGTIPYEIVSCLSLKIPRLYSDSLL
ncbi:MAG: alanine racemase [Candidatus Omnitrophica bacterium]|nr:alanine racemase [Candidatus Omnitrophota bacterium]MBD3269827.1 alanine racemase [Candidatus Omnitrophota bacterium]